MKKKSISPIIGITLLIIVGVVSAIGFQTFYQQYSTNIASKTQEQAGTGILIIDRVESADTKTSIYIKNQEKNYAIIKQIKINYNNCNMTDSDIANAKSTTKIDTDCIFNRNEKVEVVINSNFGLSQQTHIVR